MLYMATLSSIQNNTICKEYYQRLVKKGKIKKVALIATMNKLFTIIFAVVKYNPPFNTHYFKKISLPT